MKTDTYLPDLHLRSITLLFSEDLDRSRVLGTLVNNLEGMAYRCLNDLNWSMIFVSHGCKDLTGYTSAELVNNTRISWDEITHPDDRARVRDCINSAGHGGQRFTVEYRITTQSGPIKWVIERGITVSDEHGTMVIEGFIADITAQREMLEAQEQAELRYRSVFEHASEGIFQTTRDGHASSYRDAAFESTPN